MSLLIFRRKGYLVILSAIAGWAVARFLRLFVLGRFLGAIPGGIFIQNMLTVLAIAGINYGLTKHFCKPQEYKEIGPDGRERTVSVKDNSHLYGIPNRVWTWIFLIGGTGLVLYWHLRIYMRAI